MSIDKRIERVLISEAELNDGINRAAEWINTNYADKKPILVGILKGCIPFFGQLISKIKVDCRTDFMAVSSFHGGIEASTAPQITLDLVMDIKDQDVLIIEDIIDTARSLKSIVELLKKRNPRSVKILTLLDKPEGRKVDFNADYSCFTIPLVFIVGFGLDYKEYLRNLPYIGILKPEVYTTDAKRIVQGDN